MILSPVPDNCEISTIQARDGNNAARKNENKKNLSVPSKGRFF